MTLSLRYSTQWRTFTYFNRCNLKLESTSRSERISATGDAPELQHWLTLHHDSSHFSRQGLRENSDRLSSVVAQVGAGSRAAGAVHGSRSRKPRRRRRPKKTTESGSGSDGDEKSGIDVQGGDIEDCDTEGETDNEMYETDDNSTSIRFTDGSTQLENGNNATPSVAPDILIEPPLLENSLGQSNPPWVITLKEFQRLKRKKRNAAKRARLKRKKREREAMTAERLEGRLDNSTSFTSSNGETVEGRAEQKEEVCASLHEGTKLALGGDEVSKSEQIFSVETMKDELSKATMNVLTRPSLLLARSGQYLLAEAYPYSPTTASLDGTAVLLPSPASVLLPEPEPLESPTSLLTAVVEDVKASAAAETILSTAGEIREQLSDLGEVIVEALPDAMVDTMESMAAQVAETAGNVSETVSEISSAVTDTVLGLADTVQGTVIDIADAVLDTVDAVQDTVDGIKESVAEMVLDDGEEDFSEDEFEAFNSPNLPEFRGRRGIENFITLKDKSGPLNFVHDLYLAALKLSLPAFSLSMFLAPVFLSVLFTLFYLPDLQGLALEDTVQRFMDTQEGALSSVAEQEEQFGLGFTWMSIFHVFMFSLSLCTGLEPELAPLSPYTLVMANLNALMAQLVFVFLSGAVFARLSQPSQPIKCSDVAVISPATHKPRSNPATSACHAGGVLMCRYVLNGPQPCELIDVKVDLTLKYNTLTRTGSYFRAQQPLKLVI